jgi:hypothetical protein
MAEFLGRDKSVRVRGIDIVDRYRVNHCLPPEWKGEASPVSVDGRYGPRQLCRMLRDGFATRYRREYPKEHWVHTVGSGSP